MNIPGILKAFSVSAGTPAEARRQYWSMILLASACLVVAVAFAQQAQWYYGDYQAALQYCAGPLSELSTATAHCSERTAPGDYYHAYSLSVTSGEPYLLVGLSLGLLALLQLGFRLGSEMQKMLGAGDAVGLAA